MNGLLKGRVILIVEDEPVIAFDMSMSFEEQGALAIMAATVEAALVAVEEPHISAAIVDHVLGDGDSTAVCQRLVERQIPFITYSGTHHLQGPCSHSEHVNKPADPEVLITKTAALLGLYHAPV